MRNQLFVGREAEKSQIRDFINHPQKGLLVVSGKYGIGKTTLIETVLEHQEHYTLFCNSSEYHDILRYSTFGNELRKHSIVVFEDTPANPQVYELVHEFLMTKRIRKIIIATRSNETFEQAKVYRNSLFEESNFLLRQIALSNLHPSESASLFANFKFNRQIYDSALLRKFRKDGNPLDLLMLRQLLDESSITFEQLESTYVKVIKFDKPNESKDSSHVKVEVNAISDTFMEYLAYNPNGLFMISPREFEMVVARLYEKLGYRVEITPAQKDGGKDIILYSENDLFKNMYIVECKQHAETNPVGVNIVRSLIGVMNTSATKPTGGIIATTSRFTSGSQKLANDNDVQYKLSLHDYQKLSELLKKAFPTPKYS